MTEKRFSVKKSGSGLYYRDGDYEIDNTIQFIIETVEMKLNQLYDENEELKQFKEKIFTSIEKEIARNEKTIEWKKETLDLLYELLDVNEQLKQQNEFLKKRCNQYWEELGLNNDYLNGD